MNRYAYHFFEMAQLAMAPARAFSDFTRLTFKNPVNPITYTAVGRNLAASAELFERMTRRYGKPAFGVDKAMVEGQEVEIEEEIVWLRPFCQLLHFKRRFLPETAVGQPRLLIVAPMSGHYATLLRGTVETFLQTHDVHITDWVDARLVPLSFGKFDLDDYIDYVADMCQHLNEAGGPPFHILAVCQPSVPVLAAVARMESENSPHVPASMTLEGGPIDTRRNPTGVNKLAEKRGPQWFRQNCIHTVPFPYPGVGRKVYPGFLQLSGFMAMNFDRHVNAHLEMFNHLVEGDGDSAEKHRDFYDEYLAVMDLTAEFYLQTIDTVFVHHLLPKGEMKHRGAFVDLKAIRRVGLMTVEGEKDDISGVGQTEAAQDLCANIPPELRLHYLQKDVGHYGVFNGSRFRKEIAPRVCAFHAKVDANKPH
ncbi:polyhydroxyalkanoate depolymerase [Rhodoblastus sp.]|uniref:polyhydroxyalkanoate depolymerase n=1 Tax=Rhodoblastus sp. TaxID=1962975 RepID=UPI003F9AD0E0